MADPFSTLGIPSSASTDEARTAYRKLASKYHPDKVTDERQKLIVEEKFKEVKAAFELIEAGYTASPPPPVYARSSSFTKPAPAYEGTFNEYNPRPGSNPFYRRSSQAYKTASPKIHPIGPRIVEAYRPPEVRQNKGVFIAYVTITEAFSGFLCDVTVDAKKYRVQIPAGVPHGLRFTVPIEGKNDVTVITRFSQSEYKFLGVNEAVLESTIVNSEPGKVYRTKDLYVTLEVHTKDLRNGKTLEMVDIAGQKFKVKIPAGHSAYVPIVVEGHGYVDWFTSHSKCGSARGNVIVRFAVTEEVPMSHLI